MKVCFGRTALVLVGSLFLGTPAFAQATRTWVSGVGNDADPCSRTAPCKTFAGAISKTATGGEISVLDPGGFGTITITKPITISGVGEQSSILASGLQGVIVNITVAPTPPQTNTVTLRNIQINGAGLTLGTNGILSEGTSQVFITNSVLSNISGVAVHSTGSSSIAVENSEIVANNIAVQPDAGSTVRLSNNGVYNNLTGFACGTGGTLASANNNRKANNVGGVVAVCDPTVAITVQ